MTDAEKRVKEFCDKWLSGRRSCEIIHGYNGHDLTTDDLYKVLEDLAEQRMLCDLYRKEALGRAENRAAEYMAQHDLT